MMNTFKNINRKADKYGNQHFISFLSSIFSRLAYFDDNQFLKKYNSIMGQVVHPNIMTAINSVDANNLADLLDDQKIYKLDKSTNDIFANYEYEYSGKRFIDYISLNMPQNVNILNGDLKGTPNYPVPGQPAPNDAVKYISIGWSNYGEIFVVADKRMPNTIFLLFRGTYSAKTAALYTKPTSVVPLTVCKSNGEPEKFLYGIFKPSTQLIHTIIETITYLATDFLKATQPNSVKIFTTGHSLGGAMCSNFAYLWMGIKKIAPYNSAPYNILADNIVCVSLGAPRCMGKNVAKKFCNFVSQKKILYLRITTNGDPIAGVPSPKLGFLHPCSDDPNMRQQVMESCNATLTMRPTPNVNYNANLDCENYTRRIFAPNPLSHTIYLNIMYTKAVDIPKFLKGMGVAKEVLRDTDKSSVCRLVMGNNSTYKVIFFNMNKAREKATYADLAEEQQLANAPPTDLEQIMTGGGMFDVFNKKNVPPPSTQTLPSQTGTTTTTNIQPTTTPTSTPTSTPTPTPTPTSTTATATTTSKKTFKIGGEVEEDKRMTKEAFQQLISQMEPLQGDLCPQKGKMANPFNNNMMPDLSCPKQLTGGKSKSNRKTRKYRKHKTIKRNSNKRKTKKSKRNY